MADELDDAAKARLDVGERVSTLWSAIQVKVGGQWVDKKNVWLAGTISARLTELERDAEVVRHVRAAARRMPPRRMP